MGVLNIRFQMFGMIDQVMCENVTGKQPVPSYSVRILAITWKVQIVEPLEIRTVNGSWCQ